MQLRLNQREWEMTRNAAQVRGMTTAGFARSALVSEAGKPMIDAWSLKHGDREAAKYFALNPPMPHYRLEPIQMHARELTARLHASYASGTYTLVRTLTQIAERDLILERNNIRLFLRGSGVYKIINMIEMTASPESNVMVFFLELEEPFSLARQDR